MTVNFYHAKWCSACHINESMWAGACAKYGHTFNPIDVDEQPDDAGENGVKSLPTVIIDKPLPFVIIGGQTRQVIDRIVKGLND